jgi:nicotinamidase-related amidase
MTGSRTGLIVVDVQRAFDLWEAAGKRRNNPDAVARIADLLAASRARGTPIFHIRHEGTRPNSSFLPDSPGYAVKDEARERPGEPVIVKRVNSTPIRRTPKRDDIRSGRAAASAFTSPHGRGESLRPAAIRPKLIVL